MRSDMFRHMRCLLATWDLQTKLTATFCTATVVPTVSAVSFSLFALKQTDVGRLAERKVAHGTNDWHVSTQAFSRTD